MRSRAILVLLGAAALAGTPSALADNGLVQRGFHLYGQYCVACHGIAGSGKTQIGAGPGRSQTQQRVVAPSLRGVGAIAADFYLRTGYMPLPRLGMQPRRARLLLDDDQIRALVAYVSSLGRGPAVPHPHPERGNLSSGQHLFTEHCAGCHQIVGEGGYLTGALPPPLGNASATQIAEAVRIGPYVMPRFSRRSISDAQLNSVIRYVEYAKNPDDRGGWALGHLGPVPEGLVTWFLAAAVLIAVCIVVGKRLKREAA